MAYFSLAQLFCDDNAAATKSYRRAHQEYVKATRLYGVESIFDIHQWLQGVTYE
jgi:hypothetical protein